jgi:hypothetical protein
MGVGIAVGTGISSIIPGSFSMGDIENLEGLGFNSGGFISLPGVFKLDLAE